MSLRRVSLALGSALALATAVLCTAPPADANGRFPAAQHVLVGPGAQSTTIVLRTTFGFVVSDDGGATFRWICEDAFGYTGAYDPAYALDATGALHVGVPDGLVHASRDRCGFTREPGLEGQFVIDLDHSRDGATVVAVTGSGGATTRNRVYRSDDAGRTFRPLGDGLTAVLFETLEMAPSNLDRVYFTGVTQDPRSIKFYRSDDGGATIREMPLPALDGLTGAFIAGVDPTNPDVVFVRAPVESAAATEGGAGQPAGTALLRTTDGGASWREVARTRGAMMGFAISDDGRTVWIGGPDDADRLQRSDDGGASFRRVSDVQVLCLRQHAGVLYVCANYVFESYVLGRSRNGGESIEPMINLGDIAGPFTCPAGSRETEICAARWPLVRMGFPPGSSVTRDAGMDAAAGDARGASEMSGGGSCGCRAAGSGRGGLNGLWLVLAVVLPRREGRGRRRRAGTTA